MPIDRTRGAAVMVSALALAACQKSEAEKTCDGLIAQLEAARRGRVRISGRVSSVTSA